MEKNNCKGAKIGHPDKKDYGYQKAFDNKDRFCVYCIENTLNGKKYIGLTVGLLLYRIQTHFNHLANNKHRNIYLTRVYEQFGSSIFKVYCLDKSATTKEELGLLEEMYVEKYNSMSNNEGYNIAIPGIIVKPTEETRKKASEYWTNQFKTNPEKFVKFNNKNMSDESRNRMIASKKEWFAKNINPAAKPIIAYHKLTGKQYSFTCVKEASKKLKIEKGTIFRRLNKKKFAFKRKALNRYPFEFSYLNVA